MVKIKRKFKPESEESASDSELSSEDNSDAEVCIYFFYILQVSYKKNNVIF